MEFNLTDIAPNLLSLIAEIDEFKGSWRTLQHLAPERLANLRKAATRYYYNVLGNKSDCR